MLEYNTIEKYGILIARINRYGFYNINNEFKKIEIYNPNQQRQIVKTIGYKKKYKYSEDIFNIFDINSDYAPFFITDIGYFHKINEAIFLQLYDIISPGETYYENIFEIQNKLYTQNYDFYIYFVGECLIKDTPLTEELIGFDCDMIDCLLPSTTYAYTNIIIEEYHKILNIDYNPTNIQEVLSELRTDMINLGLMPLNGKLEKEKILSFFIEIEDKARTIYEKYFSVIFNIVLKNEKFFGKKKNKGNYKTFDTRQRKY